MLVLDRSVDAIVMTIDDDALLNTGLPVDRYDCLVLAGPHCHSFKHGKEDDIERFLGSILTGILPACDGLVITYKEGGVNAHALAKQTTAEWRAVSGAPAAAAHTIVKMIIESMYLKKLSIQRITP